MPSAPKYYALVDNSWEQITDLPTCGKVGLGGGWVGEGGQGRPERCALQARQVRRILHSVCLLAC